MTNILIGIVVFEFILVVLLSVFFYKRLLKVVRSLKAVTNLIESIADLMILRELKDEVGPKVIKGKKK